MKFNKIYLLLVVFFILTIGCSDLEEEVLDETSPKSLTNKQAADGYMAAVYGRLPDIYWHTNYFALQEISTDEAILPYRGGTDWGDNGIYIALHQHNFSTYDPNLKSTWSHILQSISRSFTALEAFPLLDDPNVKTYVAETRAMRAFYSMLTLDLFGLVYVENPTGPRATIIRGDEAVTYIESELLAVENEVNNAVGPGRITQGAIWGLLARLHLNAAVYRNPYADNFNFTSEDMDKVIMYCNKIINSGSYQLSTDYFSIFNDDNHTNKELIFAVDQRSDLNGHNRLAYFSLSGDQFPLTNFPNANGTDGPAITPDYYNTWEQAYAPADPATMDPRFFQQNMDPNLTCATAAQYKMNRGILRGQQYGLIREKGAFVTCPDGSFKIGKLFNVTRNKPNLPVDFTKQVDYTPTGSEHNTGYRVLKYEFGKKSDNGRNKGDADISIIRLADIYLMRAEAMLRKNNDVAAALTDVNFVRASRTATTPPPALSEMNLDFLYRERGFEFYWEMHRRTDMIRFGKYEGTWTEKSNNDKTKRIFPIPQEVIDAATQFPGYLVQNQGY
ncbi:RagB/SusD family nutrient uptake outer membrane protein [Chryseosolibacter indicus]|uniref:RagB/SusD family nutrient uptake outer membrane protein n=1 Tax=Chryseosolibacter indicus TaxID=2782351 RepID=A0ABS5VPW4_9BACT|nr:RagB/SusD family nutrient uptake outer membrane protein [Chryseosolibacter indicus]MBT1703487.1 RagB/SusD family nutrient uptake outer membrane protein [Chryseosolibacter indicus]